MSGGALQIVGNGIVIFETQVFPDHVGDNRRNSAELCVAEGVSRSGFGQELSIRVASTLADDDDTVLIFLDALFDPFQERRFLERNLGKQNDVRRILGPGTGQTTGCRDPAGMATHHFEHEYLG